MFIPFFFRCYGYFISLELIKLKNRFVTTAVEQKLGSLLLQRQTVYRILIRIIAAIFCSLGLGVRFTS